MKKLLMGIVALLAIVCLAIYFTNKPSATPVEQTSTDGIVTSVTIMVPQDMKSYDAAMNGYIFGGKPNPSPTWPFVKQVVAVASTTDAVRASAQAAAEQIPTQGGKAGANIDSFKVIDGTAYVVVHMQVDGWAGVSTSLAKIKPLVERTLLQFLQIRSVKFEPAPGLNAK